MRWLSSAAAVQLLYLLGVATAIPDYGFGAGKRLNPRREALLLFKRQDTPFCREGYYQCRPEFGGGCCPNDRKCATRDCPALSPGEQDIPGAFTDTRPPQSFTNPPPSLRATSTSQPPETTDTTTTEAPETTTEAPETTTEAPTTSSAETDTETTAPTTAPQSTEASSTGTNTRSQSGTATNAADAAETTTSNPVADGTLYTPMGISSGAIVGIVFAAITGAVIVGLVLWRAIIGIRHPKKKGRRPAPGVSGAGAAGAGGIFGGNRRIFGVFGGKKNGPGASEAMIPRSADDDNTPMSQSAAAMGFGPQPTSSEGAPPYAQDRSSLDDQDTSYNRAAYTGGDLGYRGVDTYDRQDDDTRGLFPRAGGFPNR